MHFLDGLIDFFSPAPVPAFTDKWSAKALQLRIVDMGKVFSLMAFSFIVSVAISQLH